MLNFINKVLWMIASVCLLGGGFYFSYILKFKQFSVYNIKKIFQNKDHSNITPFQSLTMSLGARIGVGSLAGIALAIKIGGVGSIFWIWISSLIVAINAFVESFLAVKYKKGENGGPAFYIKYGLKNQWLANLYAIIIVLAYIMGFLTIQANTISVACSPLLTHHIVIGIIIAVITSLVIFRTVNKIAKFMVKLVPLMCILYLIVGLIILFNNINDIPVIFVRIIKEAMNFKATNGGVLYSLIIGMQRGIFSTEAGIGSGSIAAASVDTNDGINQGLVQVVGVYFTSLIICTITALVILTSDYESVIFNNINGIEITFYAFSYHLGNLGYIILVMCILLFSFSTIISGYYYGESNIKFLFPKKKPVIFFLKILTIGLLIYGSIASSVIIWNIVDILVAVMAIINMLSLFLLKDIVLEECNVV